MSMTDGKDESSATSSKIIHRDKALFFDRDLVVLQVIKGFFIHHGPFHELTVYLSFRQKTHCLECHGRHLYVSPWC